VRRRRFRFLTRGAKIAQERTANLMPAFLCLAQLVPKIKRRGYVALHEIAVLIGLIGDRQAAVARDLVGNSCLDSAVAVSSLGTHPVLVGQPSKIALRLLQPRT
jgi:hypothetical protein